GDNRRKVLAEALRRSEVIDGVIQGSSVRLVLAEGKSQPDDLSLGAGVMAPTPPRFEDAFVDLIGGRSKREFTISTSIQPSDKSRPVVEAQDLTKRFGDFTAADNISFEIEPGEIFGLLGPNGAGKSTTFKMMCGLLRPTYGQARVAGVDLYRSGG